MRNSIIKNLIKSIFIVNFHSLSNQSTSFMSRSMSFHSENQFPTKCPSEEEDMIYVVDEMDSSHSNSPIHIPMTQRPSHEDGNYYAGMNSHSPHSNSSVRPKNKLEVRDLIYLAKFTVHGCLFHLIIFHIGFGQLGYFNNSQPIKQS